MQWRAAHPATRKFWADLHRAIRVAIRAEKAILVAPPPQPPIIAAFSDGDLTLTLPSGRAIRYPEAKLVPGKYEDAPPDIQFLDNARGQWKTYRGWFGTFVENVVQGCARDLLAAAIERFEARGIPIVFHCHDEITVEVPIGSLSEAEFLAILLKLPPWAAGLPLAGKVHTGPHYLEAPIHPAEPLAPAVTDNEVLEEAVNEYVGEVTDLTQEELGDPTELERADGIDYVANLSDDIAPLTEMVTLPFSGLKVSCPFHDDPEPSCAIYPDHFHCFGCGERGDRINWLTRVEGMTPAEAIAYIQEWPSAGARSPKNGGNDAERLAFIKSIWTTAQPLVSSIAERYLDETRQIDVCKLPQDVHRTLRFHPSCVFGPGTHLPCLIALMRDPLTDAPVGIQRIALELLNGRVAKVDRRMLGHAGVVKLWPAGPQLVIGEGLETTLAAATRIPYEGAPLVPAWATLSSTQLQKMPLIPDVKRLIVLVDNDANHEGQNAAAVATQRWQLAGRTVVRLTPDRPGTDFNDLVLEAAS
jgi:hypothetical protein